MIDILDGYIRTLEVFRVISEKTGTLPGEVMGHMGLSGEREGQPGWAARLLPLGPNWTRMGAAPPFSFPSPTPSFPLLVGLGKEESYSY